MSLKNNHKAFKQSKNRKTIFCLFICLFLSLSLVGCNKSAELEEAQTSAEQDVIATIKEIGAKYGHNNIDVRFEAIGDSNGLNEHYCAWITFPADDTLEPYNLLIAMYEEINSLKCNGLDVFSVVAYYQDHDYRVERESDRNHIFEFIHNPDGGFSIGETLFSEPKKGTSATDNGVSSLSPVSTGEKNALRRAIEYLDYSAFSYNGLIEQLEFEGYTHSEAKYGADNCGANWNEQAARKAKSYLDYSAFSRSGLIEQLEWEGFTHEQAEYGAKKNGY